MLLTPTAGSSSSATGVSVHVLSTVFCRRNARISSFLPYASGKTIVAAVWSYGILDRMRRIITINAVIACCLAVMMLLGCETPELPMEVVFSESEIACLQNFTEYSQRAVPHDLQSVVVIMAVIAGYPNRKHDLPPGHQKIRERHIQLSNMILSARIFAAAMHDCEARMHEKFRSGSGSRSVRTNH